MRSYIADKSSARKWVKASMYGIGLWGVLVLVAIFSTLDTVRTMPPGHGVNIGLGPFEFLYVYKDAMKGGGYILAINFRQGLFVLLLVCLAVEMLAIWLVYRRSAQKRLSMPKQ